MEVFSIATQNPICLGPLDTVFDAMKTMVYHKFRRIPIIDTQTYPPSKILIGVITATDILSLFDKIGISCLKIELKDAMIENPIALRQEEDLGYAIQIMTENNFGGLPIIGDENNSIAGIITEHDIIRTFVNSIADATLIEFVSEAPTLSEKNIIIKTVIRKLKELNTNRIIILNENRKIFGIITSSDVMNYILNNYQNGNGNLKPTILSDSAKKIAKKEVISMNQNQSVKEVAEFLLEKELGGVPIVDDNNQLVGVFSERELLMMIGTFGLFSS